MWGAPCVDQLLLVIGGGVIDLFKGPMAGGDATLKKGLDGREIKGALHQRTLQIGWRRPWLRTQVLLAKRPVSIRIPARTS